MSEIRDLTHGGTFDPSALMEAQRAAGGPGSSVYWLFQDLIDYMFVAGLGDLDAVLVTGNDAAGIGITELSGIQNIVNDFELDVPSFNGSVDQIHILTDFSPFDGSAIVEIAANSAGDNCGFKIYDLFGTWIASLESFQPSENQKASFETAGGTGAQMNWIDLDTSDSSFITVADSLATIQITNEDVFFQCGLSDNGVHGIDMDAPEMLIRVTDYIDISKIKCNGDMAVNDNTKGIIQKSANGHYWRQTVSNAGAATWADLGTSLP